ncbi:MAG: nuclear transport factor 2 family protein [Planctomycetes bacterium]|nr:nuclear transport factor 2 family protein [Planctomycetota bacterium]
MDFLTRLFLESPIRLGIFSFLLLSVVLLIRGRLSEKAARWSLPFTLILIPALFGMQHIVVTQREEICSELRSFISAIESRTSQAFSATLSDNYDNEGMNRGAMLDYISARLESMRVYDTRITNDDVEISGDAAEMDLLVAATVSIQGGIGDRHIGRWRIRWQREPDGWKIVGISPRMIDMVQIGSLRELRGVVP